MGAVISAIVGQLLNQLDQNKPGGYGNTGATWNTARTIMSLFNQK